MPPGQWPSFWSVLRAVARLPWQWLLPKNCREPFTISAARNVDVAALDRLNDLLAYYPSRGEFHVVKVDEADQMTDKAQLQLLSRLDGTASLRPKFGGGFEQGSAPPVIWIFTSNGWGETGTIPPSTFEPRFLSRCLVIPCEKPGEADIAQFLRRIWSLEGGAPSDDPSPLAETCDGVRDARQVWKLRFARASSPHSQGRFNLGPQPIAKSVKAEGESATLPPESLSLARRNGNFVRSARKGAASMSAAAPSVRDRIAEAKKERKHDHDLQFR